ncbi:hypothetical protein LJC31_07490, partial [Synergistaceae bacterium OttesenSCG-928-I11]|nr:hypothetical protein [Synergistaceae bacterium OttesenSCG-928-I11]
MKSIGKNARRYSLFCLMLCTVVFGASGAFAAEIDPDKAEMVEIEYNGKIISVDIRDMALVWDKDGNRDIELSNPEKYADAYANARFYGLVEQYLEKDEKGEPVAKIGQDVAPDEDADYRDEFSAMGGGSGSQEISKREYDDEQRARVWS